MAISTTLIAIHTFVSEKKNFYDRFLVCLLTNQLVITIIIIVIIIK